jgi:hypothetical protein
LFLLWSQACSEPEIIIARGETIKSKMNIRAALPTAGCDHSKNKQD